MFRKYGDVNQSEFARDSGLAQRTIVLMINPEMRNALASGKEPSPGLVLVEQAAAALGIRVCELLNPDRARTIKALELLNMIEAHVMQEKL